MDMRVSVAEGKYTFVFENNSRLVCLRYGEEWRDLVGDGAVLTTENSSLNYRINQTIR